MKEKIERKLRENLAPTFLLVEDESHKHKGHVLNTLSGESHFNITITSSVFDGKALLARHKIIYDTLSDEMKSIHALSIKACKGNSDC